MPVSRNLHQLAEQRSLALHTEIARRLPEQPELLNRAQTRVASWLASEETHALYAQRWSDWLSRPVAELVQFLQDPGELACELRQASPFAGSLDAKARFRIYRETLAHWEQTSQ